MPPNFEIGMLAGDPPGTFCRKGLEFILLESVLLLAISPSLRIFSFFLFADIATRCIRLHSRVVVLNKRIGQIETSLAES